MRLPCSELEVKTLNARLCDGFISKPNDRALRFSLRRLHSQDYEAYANQWESMEQAARSSY